jgi:2-C-methyl-D-erythritol 4-phosphate cytidylyltransferase
MSAVLVLTAAGNSTRMGGDVKKEYLTISKDGDRRVSVLSSALSAFLETRLFSIIVITIPTGGEAEARAILSEDWRIESLLKLSGPLLVFAEGGATRQESVLNGLRMAERIAGTLTDKPDVVLIHDGARPWIGAETIKDILDTARKHGAAVPAIPSVDTQKEIDAEGKIVRHLDRSRIVSVQTPQGFAFGRLLEAHIRAAGDGNAYTDDTEIWGRYCGDVYARPGSRENRKITYPGDL